MGFYGGGGGDFRHEAIFYDAMARRGLTGMNPSVHTIVAHHLLNHGTEEQKQEYGFMNEYLIARMYADARVQRIYGGTSEMMKEVISREL